MPHNRTAGVPAGHWRMPTPPNAKPPATHPDRPTRRLAASRSGGGKPPFPGSPQANGAPTSPAAPRHAGCRNFDTRVEQCSACGGRPSRQGCRSHSLVHRHAASALAAILYRGTSPPRMQGPSTLPKLAHDAQRKGRAVVAAGVWPLRLFFMTKTGIHSSHARSD